MIYECSRSGRSFVRRSYTFPYYCDPGHGWVKVPKKLLYKLGIEKEISGYSYQRGGFAYLEEDCDFSVLFNKLKEFGVEIFTPQYHTNRQSKIRGYQSYVI